MSAHPVRAGHVERALLGATLDEQSISTARRAIRLDFQPISDMRGSAEYRLAVAENLLTKMAFDIVSDEPVSVWTAPR